MTVKATLGSRFALVQGVLPINPSQVPHEIIAGLTLAALAIPEVMGYTKISGTPVITGLYTDSAQTRLPTTGKHQPNRSCLRPCQLSHLFPNTYS